MLLTCQIWPRQVSCFLLHIFASGTEWSILWLLLYLTFPSLWNSLYRQGYSTLGTSAVVFGRLASSAECWWPGLGRCRRRVRRGPGSSWARPLTLKRWWRRSFLGRHHIALLMICKGPRSGRLPERSRRLQRRRLLHPDWPPCPWMLGILAPLPASILPPVLPPPASLSLSFPWGSLEGPSQALARPVQIHWAFDFCFMNDIMLSLMHLYTSNAREPCHRRSAWPQEAVER